MFVCPALIRCVVLESHFSSHLCPTHCARDNRESGGVLGRSELAVLPENVFSLPSRSHFSPNCTPLPPWTSVVIQPCPFVPIGPLVFSVSCATPSPPLWHTATAIGSRIGVGVLGAIDVAARPGWLCIRLTPLSHTPVPTATIGLPPMVGAIPASRDGI